MGARVACGYLVSAKARERRVWVPYRGCCWARLQARLRYWGVSGGCGWPLSLLSVAGVTHASWNKRAATGVTRVGCVAFARGGLTCCSRARMLGVKCRLLPCVGVLMRLGLVSGE